MEEETAAFAVAAIRLCLPYPSDETDYDLLDTIVNHLRPKATEVGVWSDFSQNEEGYIDVDLKLQARDSLLNTLQVLRLKVSISLLWSLVYEYLLFSFCLDTKHV